MYRKFCNGALRRFHLGGEVLGIHVGLPQLVGLPVVIKHEVSQMVVLLVQVILDTARFSMRDWDQFFQLCLDQVNFLGVGGSIVACQNQYKQAV